MSKYDDLHREQLIELLKKRDRTKKLGLVWERDEIEADNAVEASNGSVVSAYEKRIAKLEREKVLAAEKLAQSSKPRHTFEESFEHAMRFLSNPWKIWNNSDVGLKKTVLRLAFIEPLPYCRNQGLRTPKST